ncbi:MAG: hypothetical protein PHI52_10125, partial [Bacteroidales bacterium]|nr:hypothetical protein [Bacteroidales bacterium]
TTSNDANTVIVYKYITSEIKGNTMKVFLTAVLCIGCHTVNRGGYQFFEKRKVIKPEKQNTKKSLDIINYLCFLLLF